MSLCICLLLLIAAGASSNYVSAGIPTTVRPGKSLVSGILPPGGQVTYQVPSSLCEGDSVLNAELWDTVQAREPQPLGDISAHADPVLFMAQGQIPKAFPSDTSISAPDWTFTPYNNVAADYFGYQLMRPYQRIRQSHDPRCPSPCSAPWYIQIFNSEHWSSFNLTYQLRVTCQLASEQQGCPSPAVSPDAPYTPKAQCSGNGLCKVFDDVCTDASFAQEECTYCECKPGWGDVGCSIPAEDLSLDRQVSQQTAAGDWTFFNLPLDAQPTGGTLVLELNRTRGDPVLFLKRRDEGFARYAVPSIHDYDLYADGISYEERLNHHSIMRMNARNAGYYVAVYNNPQYLKERASYTLRARWVAAGALLCAWDCHSHGSCIMVLKQPTCVCHQGFGGLFCEGTQQPQVLGQQSHGYLDPGQWSYFTLTLNRRDLSWQGGLAVAFLTTGEGYPVVLQKYGSAPTLLDNDRVLRSRQGPSGVQTIRLNPDALHPGTIFFAFFNVDYFVHQRFSYVFLVVPASVQRNRPNVNAYISLCLGVSLSFSAALSILLLWRWAHHRGEEGLPTLGPGRTCTGIEPETVASFPSYRYKAEGELSVTARAASTRQSKQAAGEEDVEVLIGSRRASEPVLASPRIAANTAQDPIKAYEGPSCAVCLGNYESGEMIRQLPDCHHHFHQDCIDQWLATHTTCPMCRRSLLPPDPGAVETPVSPSVSPTAHLLPLWADHASRHQQHPEMAVELRPITHRQTDDSLHGSLEDESSATALLHDSSRATRTAL